MKSMNIFKLFAATALVLLIGVTQVYAGDGSRIGTAAGVQVQVPVGARDLAMGGSDIAYTKGLSAMYWNPAGLAHICLLYTSPSPRDGLLSRMPSSA